MPNPSRRRRRLARTLLLIGAAVVAASASTAAQLFVPTGRDTLRKLPGVEVLVEPLQPELQQAGLTDASLAAAVTTQLKAAGVVVYPSQRENPSPSKPYVYVHVNAAGLAGGGFAIAVQVHLRQTLQSLTTESRVVNAMSWDAHDVIVSSPASLRSDLTGEIRELVSLFIDDWKSVHGAP